MNSDHDKALKTLQARAALEQGMTCTQTAAGYIVMSRMGCGGWIFDNVGKATAWLDRLPQPTTEVQP